jgi:ferredoxin
MKNMKMAVRRRRQKRQPAQFGRYDNHHKGIPVYKNKLAKPRPTTIATMPFLSYRLQQPAQTAPVKMEDNRSRVLQTLRQQVRAIETDLHHLEQRIKNLGEQGINPIPKALVDSEICVGCGICRDVCPAEAISIETIARVDSSRCNGCGHCLETCPQGALSLAPVNTKP